MIALVCVFENFFAHLIKNILLISIFGAFGLHVTIGFFLKLIE